MSEFSNVRRISSLNVELLREGPLVTIPEAPDDWDTFMEAFNHDYAAKGFDFEYRPVGAAIRRLAGLEDDYELVRAEEVDRGERIVPTWLRGAVDSLVMDMELLPGREQKPFYERQDIAKILCIKLAEVQAINVSKKPIYPRHFLFHLEPGLPPGVDTQAMRRQRKLGTLRVPLTGQTQIQLIQTGLKPAA